MKIPTSDEVGIFVLRRLYILKAPNSSSWRLGHLPIAQKNT